MERCLLGMKQRDFKKMDFSDIQEEMEIDQI